MLDVDQRFCRGGVAGSEASMSATAGGIGVETRRTGTSGPFACVEVGTEYIDKTSYMLARPSSLSRSTMSDRTENGRTPVLLRGAAAAAAASDDDSFAARREFRSLIKLSLLNPPAPISGDELSETEVASECQPASSVAVEDEKEADIDVEANEVPVEMDADDEVVDGGGAGKPIGNEGEPPGPFFVGSDEDDDDVFRIEGPGRGASGPALETILSRAEIVARFCCCFLSADERDQGNERSLRPMLVPVALVASTAALTAGETRS